MTTVAFGIKVGQHAAAFKSIMIYEGDNEMTTKTSNSGN